MLEQAYMVLSTTVELDGEARAATYFVEHNLIYAMIGERFVICAVEEASAEQTVRALLIQAMLAEQRRGGEDTSE